MACLLNNGQDVFQALSFVWNRCLHVYEHVLYALCLDPYT